MKVTIVGHTHNAAELMIMSKNTRLEMSADLMDNINMMSDDEK